MFVNAVFLFFYLEEREMSRQSWKEKHIFVNWKKKMKSDLLESLIFVLVLPVAKINKEYGGERVVAAR